MQLTHKIAMQPTKEQVAYFKKAAGTARRVWNWALSEWNRQFAAGQKPNAMKLKKQFNQIKYTLYPWLSEMHRDSHSQPFAYLGKAWHQFFKDLKAGQEAHQPVFKKKGKSRDSFYVANDKFKLSGNMVRLPKVGDVMLRESLRFSGKILGATVSRTANRWYMAIQVDVPDHEALQRRIAHGVVGVDLGVSAAATLSDGEKILSPMPLKNALRRLRLRSRRLSRKVEAAKAAAGYKKGVILPVSRNRSQCAQELARLHARIANLRADFTHKLTTRLCRENQAVVIEDLNVKGMLANDKLSRAISDVGFSEIRRQLAYKAKRYGTRVVIADRWYASSRLCSVCDWKNENLALKDREWTCAQCKAIHDRDVNAAMNLKRLATVTALPVANQPATEDTVLGMVPSIVGKVTPVRDECGRKDTSGQEENRAHLYAHF